VGVLTLMAVSVITLIGNPGKAPRPAREWAAASKLASAQTGLYTGPDAGSPDADASAPSGPTAAEVAARWSAERQPHQAAPRAIGTYAAGCVDGAVALAPSGPGYEVLHLGRRRRYGHPVLVDFVRRLGAEVKKRRLGMVLVGDLGQPRGGPTPSGHRSHQTGLDVDIGYTFPRWALRRRITSKERESIGPPAVVDLASNTVNAQWEPRVLQLLQLAASDPAVERIFVNPVVKREACARTKPGTEWLRKLRPWWLHHDHFHARMRCPADSVECEAQPPLGPEDGCGEPLRWWFTEDARASSAKRTAQEPPAPALPAACGEILTGGATREGTR
jgi:penicillin-insensitive murein endopeptidase